GRHPLDLVVRERVLLAAVSDVSSVRQRRPHERLPSLQLGEARLLDDAVLPAENAGIERVPPLEERARLGLGNSRGERELTDARAVDRRVTGVLSDATSRVRLVDRVVVVDGARQRDEEVLLTAESSDHVLVLGQVRENAHLDLREVAED